MAKGGMSKRWMRSQGSDRSTVTQNSKKGSHGHILMAVVIVEPLCHIDQMVV